ncbi:SusD/RagB family nutrient-binding outer membrane lipoprotein [Segetibacter koreensis]|uniref:SusD/RagB family nutrient-binding outer membrane lipoprotein n=1 Tax=Segetibacter koreensis TaxID=398037 RepID=UPI00036D5751|nr:SusD/RagB family nutrient-binding outer membrane lipoprotein [Segetibacter koreensis]
MFYEKKTFSFIIILAITLSSSCKKDFLDINNDPNRVTENNITSELIFPQAAHATGARLASRDFQFLDTWIGYWGESGDFAIDQTETTYNISFDFGNTLWLNQYNVLFDLYLTKVKALSQGDTVLAGASIILSAKLWQELVDLYGNVPYSQAFNNNKYTQPSYDNASDIYASLQQNLDTAIAYMGKEPRSTFEKVDIVNHGDEGKWIKFANTLKLRLLIRQSEVSGFNPGVEVTKIEANGGVLHQGESVTVNPGYSNATNKQSPFYANYGLTPTGAEANTSTRANAYFVNLLSSTSDQRISRFFAPPSAGGPITGTVFGLAAGNPKGANSSAIGPGLVSSPEQDQWIYPSFESMFLEAEAIARGWIPGDAKAAYEAAVTESFVWLGVENAETEAANYLQNAVIANWNNAGTSVLEKAKFIAYQKYIALAGIDPLEAYSDLRRLNMIPNKGYISVNPGKVSQTLPVRLLYAQSEYTTNANNAKAQGNINPFTSKIFWQP